MASSLVVKLLCLVIVCLALGAPKAKATVSCNQVVNSLTPCVRYVAYGGNTVPQQCCDGVKSLYGMAQNTPDRQTVCTCIKNAIKNLPISNTNLKLAAELPKKCGVNIPYQISPSIDCSRVQ